MTSKKFYAVWDEGRSRFTVGRGLIFLEEVNVALREYGSEEASFVWCSANPPPALFDLPSWSGAVLRYADNAEAQAALPLQDGPTWGFRACADPCSLDESLLYLQHKCGAQLPVLDIRETWRQKARDFISQTGRNRRRAVLHLKRNPKNILSNADLGEWGRFIRRVGDEWLFILVGNERPDGICELPNVKWTGGAELLLDLALIREGDVFMGMSSGLCQMAMFGPKPYVIFKHPDHHTQEMRREFEGRKSFSFNNERQRFMMAQDRYDTLLNVFQELVTTMG